MSILDTKINSVASIAIETATNLADNYYDKDYITNVIAAANGAAGGASLFQYYNMTAVDTLLTNYQTKGSYLTSGSLLGYVTTGSIPTNYLTSGSLIGYLTSGSLLGYVTTGSIPSDYLTSGSLLLYARTASIPTSFLTSGSLLGYLTSGSLLGYATTGSIPTDYLTSGSLLGYARTTSIPTSFLTSGSLIGYLTSGSLLGYLTSGSLLGYATTGSIPTNYLTSGSLVGYATTGSIIPITALGTDNASTGFRLLNPVNQYQTRALKGSYYINLGVSDAFLTIEASDELNNVISGKQGAITVSGNDDINNFKLLDGSAFLRSLRAGGYMQIIRDNTTLLITASSALQMALDGKQSSITVGGDDVSSFKLLRSNGLASIASSDTITPVITTNADGTPLIRFNSTLDVGSLTGYAPTASPAFTGTVSFAGVSSITGLTRLDGTVKDFGLSEYIGNQLSFYASKQNPEFNGSVTATLFNAKSSITIMGNTVPTALQISNTFLSYLTSSGATSLYATSTGITSTLTSYLTSSGATSLYATSTGITSTLTSYLTSSGATSLYATSTGVTSTLTSYLTTSSASSTYAPKNNPVFNGIVSTSAISATGNILTTGQVTGRAIRGLPSSDGGETNLIFYRNANGVGDGAGEQWIMGHGSHAVGDRNWAIGSSAIGRCLSISSTGVLNFHQPAIFNSSLTLGSNNLQTQLSTLAPKASPTFTGQLTATDVLIQGKLSYSLAAALPSPTISLNTAWGNGNSPIFSRLGRWTGTIYGGNIILRVVFALGDYGTANSIGELTVHYTLGRTQPSTNIPSALCYGDGFVLTTSASVWERNVYVVPVSYNEPYATVDFWVDSSGYPGNRLIVACTANAAIKSGLYNGDGTWVAEQNGASSIGVNSWPPTTRSEFGYPALSDPFPYLKLPNAINYTSLTPPPSNKPQYAARFAYSGGGFLNFTSWGANTLTVSNVTRIGSGFYKFIVSVPLQTSSIFLATSHGGSLTYASVRVESNTVWYVYTTNFTALDDLDVGFITVP